MDLAANRRADLSDCWLLLVDDCAHPAGGVLLVEAASASIGDERLVLEDPQSHLCLWRHRHRRFGTLLESTLFPVGFGSSDSAANLARTKRGAHSGRKVRGRVSRLPQTKLVLDFSWNRSNCQRTETDATGPWGSFLIACCQQSR